MRRFKTHVVGLALASGLFLAVGGQVAVAADPVWMLRATTGPGPRTTHAMTYDSARGVTVLFGGVFCPVGTCGNSPAVYCWVTRVQGVY
jgi:hypothetical protein